MSDNRLELKRRLTESRHKDSEATFMWRTFYGGSPKIILMIFAIADQVFSSLFSGLLLALGNISILNRFVTGVAIGKFDREVEQSSG
jgi:hypothetical protein